MHNTTVRIILAAMVATALVAGVMPTASAITRVVVTDAPHNVGLDVWVDGDRDVYDSFGDLTVSIRAQRDCYATVFVVDTDGYIHVVFPFSPHASAFIRGHRTYRYSAYELGLDGLRGRGIAHVFAVGSPVPFNYDPYGSYVFIGAYGYRIYGDPFEACRDFYLPMLASRCDRSLVSVSVARVYVGGWVRYPSYLCHGHAGLHVRVGSYCNQCRYVYDAYRVHVADPWCAVAPGATPSRNRHNGFVERVVNAKKRGTPQEYTRQSRGSAIKYREANAVRRVTTGSRVVESAKSGRTTRGRVVSTDRDVTRSKVTRSNDKRVAVKSKSSTRSTRTTERTVARKDTRASKRKGGTAKGR